MDKDKTFLGWIKLIENFVLKVLSLVLIIVIFVAVFDLGLVLIKELFTPPVEFLGSHW